MRAAGVGVFLLLASISLLACGKRKIRAEAERVPNELESERSEIVIVARGMYTRPPEHNIAECELGQRKPCWSDARMAPSPSHMLYMTCVKSWDGGANRYSRAACNTPLVVSFDDQEAIRFTKPSADAASFTVGTSNRTEWVSSRTPWLALDVDGSGCIEGQSELFGPPKDGTNGFHKLARLDANHDGRIDEHDPAFASLVLWSDENQDKRCTPSEVTKLADVGVVSLELEYATPLESRSMGDGSYEGEHATLWFRRDGALRRGRLVDVYLAPSAGR